MRTTLTLDSDVVALIEHQMHSRHLSMKDVVNDALRTALGPSAGASGAVEPYTVRVHTARLAPGLDPVGFNRLADELEDAAVVDRARRAAAQKP
jgi:hypothetical protein